MDIYGVTSYDDAFDSRFSVGFSYSFGKSQNRYDNSVILKALSSSPGNRNIRIHDCDFFDSCWWENLGVKTATSITSQLTTNAAIDAIKKIYKNLSAPQQKLADEIEANPSEALEILAENPELDAEVLAEVIAE